MFPCFVLSLSLCLLVCLVCFLVFLVGWLVGWLADWLVGWFVGFVVLFVLLVRSLAFAREPCLLCCSDSVLMGLTFVIVRAGSQTWN